MNKSNMVYRTAIERALLKDLSVKSDKEGARHVILHYTLILITIILFWITFSQGHLVFWIITLYVLGPLYNFLGWSGMGHELLHQTFFASRRLNKIVLVLNSLPLMNNWAYHEISHKIHHRNTLQTGIDYEFDPEQKVLVKWDLLLSLTIDIKMFIRGIKNTVGNAFNYIPGSFSERHLLPESIERKKVVFAARIICAFHISFAILAVLLNRVEIFLLTTIAPFIFTFPTRALTLSQHVGMPEDQFDFRLNSRSVTLPKWISWLYCNMNFHIEHHMYSSVTSHNLPKLNELIAFDLGKPISVRELLRLVTTETRASDKDGESKLEVMVLDKTT